LRAKNKRKARKIEHKNATEINSDSLSHSGAGKNMKKDLLSKLSSHLNAVLSLVFSPSRSAFVPLLSPPTDGI
jgi:hypothetical protein